VQIFDRVAASLADYVRQLYLEFGASGAATQSAIGCPPCRSQALRSTNLIPLLSPNGGISMRHRGLSTDSKMPVFEDPECHVVQGIFHARVGKYSLPAQDGLVILIGGDLYPSTRTVLSQLADLTWGIEQVRPVRPELRPKDEAGLHSPAPRSHPGDFRASKRSLSVHSPSVLRH